MHKVQNELKWGLKLKCMRCTRSTSWVILKLKSLNLHGLKQVLFKFFNFFLIDLRGGGIQNSRFMITSLFGDNLGLSSWNACHTVATKKGRLALDNAMYYTLRVLWSQREIRLGSGAAGWVWILNTRPIYQHYGVFDLHAGQTNLVEWLGRSRVHMSTLSSVGPPNSTTRKGPDNHRGDDATFTVAEGILQHEVAGDDGAVSVWRPGLPLD